MDSKECPNRVKKSLFQLSAPEFEKRKGFQGLEPASPSNQNCALPTEPRCSVKEKEKQIYLLLSLGEGSVVGYTPYKIILPNYMESP